MMKGVGVGFLQSAFGVSQRDKCRDFWHCWMELSLVFSSRRLASRGGTTAANFGNDEERSRRLVSCRGTNAAIFGIAEGSRRWVSPVGVGHLAEGQTPQFLRLKEGQIRWFSALQPKLRHSSYSMYTVPILQLLPQYEKVKGDDDVRGFSLQNLMVRSSYLILLFCCLYVQLYVFLPACITIYQSYVCVGRRCVEAAFRVGT